LLERTRMELEHIDLHKVSHPLAFIDDLANTSTWKDMPRVCNTLIDVANAYGLDVGLGPDKTAILPLKEPTEEIKRWAAREGIPIVNSYPSLGI